MTERREYSGGRAIHTPKTPRPRPKPRAADRGSRIKYVPARDAYSGHLVSPAPRRDPDSVKKRPMAGIEVAWTRMNVTERSWAGPGPTNAYAIHGAKMKLKTPINPMMRIDSFVASRAVSSARLGSFAPRFCPTSALEAILRPRPGMNTNDWIRSPICWAASASSPKDTTITIHRRRPTWNATCSVAAGTPTRTILRIVCQFTSGVSHRMLIRSLWRAKRARYIAAPVVYAIEVPIAAPWTPRAGNPKFPKIRV